MCFGCQGAPELLVNTDLLHWDAEMSLWEVLGKQSLFACVFGRAGGGVHVLAYSWVHFTCILRRQPCKEITSASVVFLCSNKGPAAGELLPLLVCLPSDQTTSFLRCNSSLLHLHISNHLLCPTPQLSHCLWLPGEKEGDAKALSTVVECWFLIRRSLSCCLQHLPSLFCDRHECPSCR